MVEDYAHGRITLKITQPAVELSAINGDYSPLMLSSSELVVGADANN